MLAGTPLTILLLTSFSLAQMKAGSDMPGYAEAFGLSQPQQASDYNVEEIEVQAGANTMVNVLWPGERLRITLHFVNEAQSAWKAHGKLEVVSYGTSVPPGDVWVPHVVKLADKGFTAMEIDLPASGAQDITIQPQIPERFGGYALILKVMVGPSWPLRFARSCRIAAGCSFPPMLST
jgi:hypothetical protein